MTLGCNWYSDGWGSQSCLSTPPRWFHLMWLHCQTTLFDDMGGTKEPVWLGEYRTQTKKMSRKVKPSHGSTSVIVFGCGHHFDLWRTGVTNLKGKIGSSTCYRFICIKPVHQSAHQLQAFIKIFSATLKNLLCPLQVFRAAPGSPSGWNWPHPASHFQAHRVSRSSGHRPTMRPLSMDGGTRTRLPCPRRSHSHSDLTRPVLPDHEGVCPFSEWMYLCHLTALNCRN